MKQNQSLPTSDKARWSLIVAGGVPFEVHLSHADRNLIKEILEANQSNILEVAKALMQQLDTSIGVSMATYPVQLHANQAAWLRSQISIFEACSTDAILKFLVKDTLPLLKQKLGHTDPTAYTAIQGRYATAQHRMACTWLDHGIVSKAFTSAVAATALACLAMWGIIEALHYFTTKP